MYINYTVKPSNITEKRVVTKWEGEGLSMREVEKVLTIDTYSPNSTICYQSPEQINR